MKKSISTRLFIGITAMGIVFLLSSWILNNSYLEKLYIKEKKTTLLENSKKIDDIYTGYPKDIFLQLQEIESKTGSYIFLLNENGRIKYNSFFNVGENDFLPFYGSNENDQNTTNIRPKRRNLPIPPPPKANELVDKKYVFTMQNDNLLKTEFMVLTYVLSNGDILISVTSLAPISESAKIANNFLLYTGIFIIVFGIIVTYLFSKRFTRPILHVNSVVRDIAKLDFSKKCEVKSDDEIGELARSINLVSEKLESTIMELNEKNKKLQEDILRERKIDEMRKEFISNVSHELKTPLALIQGYAEGLKSNVANNQEDKEFYCDVIMDETKKMDRLVKDLLKLSHLESEYNTLEKQNFNINNLVNRIIQKYEPIFKEENIKFIWENNENIEVLGDKLKIEQVIINYINNAINHGENEKVVKISLEDFVDKVRITVFNTGKNIPEEYLAKIWDSFYKVDKARTRSYGGSGLGLSIVKEIMNLHGNDFGVKNVENGVEFWFELDKVKM